MPPPATLPPRSAHPAPGPGLTLDVVLVLAAPSILLVAALVPAARPAVAVLLPAGWLVLAAARRPAAIASAAVVPVAVVLAWPWVLGADVPVGDPACRDPLSAIAVRRVVVGVAGLGLVAVLAGVHRSNLTELGLRRPRRPEAAVAVAGAVALVLGGLVLGPAIARPFFGPLDFPVPPAALLPAIAFGIANGVLEEVAYRGAMQAWLGRVLPVGAAIGAQALVFGVVHVGPEVVDLVPVHAAMLTAVGLAGGIARWRLGSLWIPIGIHVGADVALYVGLACRPAG